MAARIRPRARRSQRGAVVVEAAIITPLFLFGVFACLEAGLAFRTWLSLSHAATEGARVASVAASDSMADYQILKSVKEATAAMPKNSVEQVIVFNADDYDSKPPSGCYSGSGMSNVCNTYEQDDFDDTQADFLANPDKDDWKAQDRNVVRGATTGPDYVGVYVKTTHKHTTMLLVRGVFGKERVLTRTTVMQIEAAQG